MSEQKKSFSWLLLLGAVLVAGGTGAYFYLQGTWRKLTPIDSAKVVPEDTMLAAYIDTDSRNWSKLQQFGTPEAQAAIGQRFETFQNEMFASNQLNYEKDLKPWVGDVTIAILPPSIATDANADPESSTTDMESAEITSNADSNILFIVGIKNPFKAWMFKRNLQSQPNIKTEKIDYNGVTISASVVNEAPPAYSAVIGKYLVMSEDRLAVERAIDTSQGTASFAESQTGADILKNGRELENSVAQIYLPNSKILTQQFQENVSENTDIAKQLSAIKSVIIGAEIEESGVRVQTIAKVNTDAFEQPELPPAEALLLNRFPSETIALVTGQELKRSWTTAVEQTESDPMMQEIFDSLRTAMKETLNLDLDQDIFSWMDGQFALGLILSDQGVLAQLGFGGALLFETSDRPLAEASLKKIDESLKKSFPFPLETDTKTYQSIEVTEWKIPLQGLVLGGHGWLDGDILFIGFGQPMLDVISQPVSNPLNSSQNFQAIASSLPTPNQGYFYLDMDRVMTLINRAPLPPGNQIPPETLAILNSIQGVGVTSTWPESDMNQMDMWLAFKPGQ